MCAEPLPTLFALRVGVVAESDQLLQPEGPLRLGLVVLSIPGVAVRRVVRRVAVAVALRATPVTAALVGVTRQWLTVVAVEVVTAKTAVAV